MSAKLVTARPVERPTGSPRELCQTAIRLMGEAVEEAPAGLSKDVDVAERTVVAIRDGLIDRLRAGEDVRDTLGRVNQVVSLIAGVEYPTGGAHRDQVKQARDTLQAIEPVLPA